MPTIDDLIHIVYDVFYIIDYLIQNLAQLFAVIFTPLTWIFNFVRGFFISAFSTPTTPALTWIFPDNVVSFFNAIPYFNTFTFAIGAGLSIVVLVFIFKRLTSI